MGIISLSLIQITTPVLGRHFANAVSLFVIVTVLALAFALNLSAVFSSLFFFLPIHPQW